MIVPQNAHCKYFGQVKFDTLKQVREVLFSVRNALFFIVSELIHAVPPLLPQQARCKTGCKTW